MGIFPGLILKPVGVDIDSTGLIAFYPFNGNANDESDNGHDGSLVNSPSLITGVNGDANSAYDFNGSNQRIDISSVISIPTNAPYTLSWWHKLNAAASNSNFYSSFSFKSTDVNKEYYTFTHGSAPYKDLFYGHNAMKAAINYPFNNFKGVWVHIVIVRTSGGVTNRYIDNVFKTANIGGAVGIGSISRSTIGATNSNAQYFYGILDQLRFYSREITLDEIAFLFNNKI